jgi:F0F1-type ATP synthase assembly protein I
LIGLGMQVTSEVAAGVLLGIGVDYLLGTRNRWVVVGALVGVAVAMWTMIRTAMRLAARDAARRRKAEGGGARETSDSSSAQASIESSGTVPARQPGQGPPEARGS